MLPKRIQRELKEITFWRRPNPSLLFWMKAAMMKALKESIRQVKLLKAGKQKTTPWNDFLEELKDEQRI